MRLKLDENLGHMAADLFRQAGHDVETVPGEGLASSPDGHILNACQQEQRCLVTLDLDFSNPLRFPPERHFGIAVLRLPRQPSPRDLLFACQTLDAALAREKIAGKLWTVQRGRVRKYHPERDRAAPDDSAD